MNRCEFCGIEHDGNYGSGRFCSSTCARKFSNTFVSEAGRENQIKALTNKENKEKSIATNRSLGFPNLINIKNTKKQYRDDLRPKFNHTLTLGKIGELEVSKKFLEHGYNVYLPLVDSGDGIDMVISKDGNKFKKVQVKSSTASNINDDKSCETTTFKICKNVRHIHEGTYTQKASKYSPEQIDYIALYSAYDDEVYLLENTNDLPMGITIRNNKTNICNKDKVVRYAEDLQIDRVLDNSDLIRGVYYNEEIS